MENEVEIAKSILKHRIGEEQHFALQRAVGQVNVNIADVDTQIFWLVNSELARDRGLMSEQRFVENKKIEKSIAKNSPFGGFLIQRKSGDWDFTVGVRKVNLQSFASYEPKRNPIDAANGLIEIKGRAKVRFMSLFDIISTDQVQEEIEVLEEEWEESRSIVDEIERKISDNAALDITHYIRTNNELRMQHILDEHQDEKRRKKILDGMLIIDGGPGTGKTTVLISRIKFLIDDTLEEYDEKYKRIIPELQGRNGWILFTPSALLLGFLRNAMSSEGLPATDQNSKVWNTFINNEVLRKYGLTGTDKPFSHFHKHSHQIIVNKPELIQVLLQGIEKQIIKSITSRLTKLAKSKLLVDEWKKLGLTIQKNIEGVLESKDIITLINNLSNISISYKKEVDRINTTSKDVNEFSGVIISRLRKDVDSYNLIIEHLKNEFDKRNKLPEETDLEDEVEEDENLKPISTDYFDEEVELLRNIRILLRNLALNRASNEPLSKKNEQWIKVIERYVEGLDLMDLGARLHFFKNIIPLVRGPEQMVFGSIVRIYKRYRTQIPNMLIALNQAKEARLFEQVLESKEHRLHYDERNLLVLFINSLLRSIKLKNREFYDQMNNQYVSEFKGLERYVVGVDEASDFSLLEIATINSFSNPSYNCTTLCGDIMQRMTGAGVSDWQIVSSYFKNAEFEKLRISYRQSPRLLEVAKSFYKKVTGGEADYVSYAEPSNVEPEPLIVHISDENDKVEWVAERLLEINKAYSNEIPSVAIFVANEDQVIPFAKKLGNNDLLLDNGIAIKGVSDQGSTIQAGQVSVYSIQAIKGLEFEVVFFLDIDELSDELPEELVLKYLYVGISRAAYYLFITYKTQLPSALNFMKTNN